ncbi:MAG TPA: hypothetical protein DEH22_00445 [Chloroflexi bacterium]|nr:hypothetical protein [Chloroflexota bacterium]
MLRIILRKHKPEKAQSMVEFALILPLLLLLILGIVEFGRLLFFYSSVTSASREAARYGSAVGQVGGVDRYADCSGILAAAQRAGVFAGIEEADITIQYDNGTALLDADCPPSADIGLADRVVVTVSKGFTPVVALVNIPPIPVTSTTARTIIKEVGVRGTPAPTATPRRTATNTPVGFVASNTPTPTRTATATATATATSTRTATATATNTGTLAPSSTPLPPTNTPVNTPTRTSTPTPTNTPVPICGLEFRNFQQPSARKITWDLYNNPGPGVLDVTVLSFYLSFPESRLTQIDFGGATIWTGHTSGSPTTVNPSDWSGQPADRLITVNQTKTFTLFFVGDVPATGYTIRVSTDYCVDPVSGTH